MAEYSIAMEGYSTTNYLLDRANITDTVRKMGIYHDTRNMQGLVDKVFSGSVTFKDSPRSANRPFTISGREYVATLEEVFVRLHNSQNSLSNVLVRLPQPGPEVCPPDVAGAYSQGTTRLARFDVGGGPFYHTGSTWYFHLIRTRTVGDVGDGNPWRINRCVRSSQKWEDGNICVTFGCEAAF